MWWSSHCFMRCLLQVVVKEELVYSGEELQDSDLNYQVCTLQSFSSNVNRLGLHVWRQIFQSLGYLFLNVKLKVTLITLLPHYSESFFSFGGRVLSLSRRLTDPASKIAVRLSTSSIRLDIRFWSCFTQDVLVYYNSTRCLTVKTCG